MVPCRALRTWRRQKTNLTSRLVRRRREGKMLNHQSDRGTPLLLALAVWACTLPFIGLLILPTLGLGVAATVALIVLVLLLAICWAVCWWPILR